MTIDTRQQKLALWLRQQRQARNMTMRDVAAILDRPHSFIGKIEKCERRVEVAEFIDYCERLGFDALAGFRAAL